MNITAVILTKNEELNIEKCIQSLTIFDEIVIIDDYSTDKTVEIAKKAAKENNLKIYQRKLNKDFAEQRNYAITKSSNDWIFFIDADEVVTPNLQQEIKKVLTKDTVYDSFYIKRKDFFWNQELKFGETSKVRKLGLVRLIKKGTGKWLGRVHEVFYTSKKIGQLESFLNHYSHPTLKSFIEKINYYSTLRAEELFIQNKKTNFIEIIFYPFFKFIYNYFFKLGILDGPAGFTYAFLMSFHSFLVRAKLFQLTRLNK